MRSASLLLVLAASLAAAPLSFAQTPAPDASPSPTPARAYPRKQKVPKPSASPTDSTGTTSPAPSPTSRLAKKAKGTPNQPSATQAPGGGPGTVWVNTRSKVYHGQASKWYGRTKHGKYMSEADAKAAGNHAAPGKE